MLLAAMKRPSRIHSLVGIATAANFMARFFEDLVILLLVFLIYFANVILYI